MGRVEEVEALRQGEEKELEKAEADAKRRLKAHNTHSTHINHTPHTHTNTHTRTHTYPSPTGDAAQGGRGMFVHHAHNITFGVTK